MGGGQAIRGVLALVVSVIAARVCFRTEREARADGDLNAASINLGLFFFCVAISVLNLAVVVVAMTGGPTP